MLPDKQSCHPYSHLVITLYADKFGRKNLLQEIHVVIYSIAMKLCP